MATKSPTLSIRSREIIGGDQFSQRREVFGKHNTVFLPSPISVAPLHMEVESRETSSEVSNFRRTPAYSSMRETRKEDIRTSLGFRERKLSDNFTSDLNQSDDVDYRHSMTERTRRLSKLRRDFLTSNLHEPSNQDQFARIGSRASLPVRGTPAKYKVESLTIHKFPFAEPFATPPPTRKVFLDLGQTEVDSPKENQDPSNNSKHQSLPTNDTFKEVDHHKLFSDLINRYSPQRKPIDWTLPPTKPRVVGSLPKTNSLEITEDGQDDTDKNVTDVTQEENTAETSEELQNDTTVDEEKPTKNEEKIPSEPLSNGKQSSELKTLLTELEEKNDKVPELPPFQRQTSREPMPKRQIEVNDTIPALLQKISAEESQSNKSDETGKTKLKRKRSFLDRLLNRKKEQK